MSKALAPQVKALVWGEPFTEQPHPYLTVWVGCRRYSTEMSRLLPSAGGWLDQDAELMLAFGICEDTYQEESEVKKRWDAAQHARVPLQTTGGEIVS